VSDGWESATFEGLVQVRARELSGTTAEERFLWLMDALELAAASGALAQARAEKQAACDRLWWGQGGAGAVRQPAP